MPRERWPRCPRPRARRDDPQDRVRDTFVAPVLGEQRQSGLQHDSLPQRAVRAVMDVGGCLVHPCRSANLAEGVESFLTEAEPAVQHPRATSQRDWTPDRLSRRRRPVLRRPPDRRSSSRPPRSLLRSRSRPHARRRLRRPPMGCFGWHRHPNYTDGGDGGNTTSCSASANESNRREPERGPRRVTSPSAGS